jgi:hypothetical protein
MEGHPIYPSEELAAQEKLPRQDLFAAMQFGQGDIFLQEQIFAYLKHLHPNLRLTPEEEKSFMADSMDAVRERFYDRRRHAPLHPVLDIIVPGATEYNSLKEVLMGARNMLNGPVQDLDELLPKLLSAISFRDQYYLEKPEGRGYLPNDVSHYNPYTDRWRSDLCYFGFLGHKTGRLDFDRLFADVTAYYHAHAHEGSLEVQRKNVLLRVLSVIRLFNTHHPMMPVDCKANE